MKRIPASDQGRDALISRMIRSGKPLEIKQWFEDDGPLEAPLRQSRLKTAVVWNGKEFEIVPEPDPVCAELEGKFKYLKSPLMERGQ